MTAEPYTVQVLRSRRKTVGIEIRSGTLVLVRAPLRMSAAEIRRLVNEKRGWIESHLAEAARRENAASRIPPLTEPELRSLANQAKDYFPSRVRVFADLLGVRYSRICIRHQKTRWGSCSSKGGLNFNCLLMLCPPEVRDYVIVHELCHRKEMNHSPRFWAEVEKLLPDYRQQRQWLKTNGQELLARIPTR